KGSRASKNAPAALPASRGERRPFAVPPWFGDASRPSPSAGTPGATRSLPWRCNGRRGGAASLTAGGTASRPHLLAARERRVGRAAPGPSSAEPPTPACTRPGSLRSADLRLLLPFIACIRFNCLRL